MGGLTAALRRHRRIGFDTPLFIYLIERHARYGAAAKAAFQALRIHDIQGVTSALTLMEVAVQPLRMGRSDVVDEYEALILSIPNLEIADLERPVMRRAAELRANHRLLPADALQLATCAHRGATAMLTNDKGWRRVNDIEILVLDDYLNE